MPKQRFDTAKRVNIYLPPRHLEVAAQIENLSNFVQLALDNAADIMAWAILRDVNPKMYNTGREVEDVVEEFNEKFPKVDKFGKREEVWRKSYQNKRELW